MLDGCTGALFGEGQAQHGSWHGHTARLATDRRGLNGSLGTGTAGPLVRLAFPPRGRGSVVWPRREELTARAAGAGVRAG